MTINKKGKKVKKVQIKKGKNEKTTTFIDNMKLPLHRWFRYSAGFSAQWVESVIENYIVDNNIQNRSELYVLDPFAGSGTAMIAGEKVGVKAIGFESHPFVTKLTESKLLWRTDIDRFKNFAHKVLQTAQKITGEYKSYPDLIQRCYSSDVIKKLDTLKKGLYNMEDNSAEYKLTWLALVSILRSASKAGTAQWQYVLPNKTKIRVSEPYEAFQYQIDLMIEDMHYMQNYINNPQAILYEHDARIPFNDLQNQIDLIITSPPYANNYDYADATRLEMTFFGMVEKWADLQDVVRPHLVRSCTQHVSRYRSETFNIIEDELLHPIYDEINEVCSKLEIERENHSGKKNYHTMIALYFVDLAKIWRNLRLLCKEGSTICFVVGDSAPYGVHVPVDKWLGELALSAGFREYHFEKTRDRNVKWKLDRKHSVPLKEGRLWIKG